MRIYQDLTDDQVRAELVEYRTALRKLAHGGIAAVGGEGRRVEYARGDIRLVRTEIRALQGELLERGLVDQDGDGGRAIPVEIG